MIREPVLIDARELRHGEELRVALAPYRAKTYLNIRRWYRPAPGAAFQPGKGISLNPALLPWLRRALDDAERVALDAGLLDEEAFEACGLPVPAALLGDVAA
jgi:hypothetical protein